MIVVMKKSTMHVIGWFDNINLVKRYCIERGIDYVNDIIKLKEMNMNYVGTITYVDDNVVYYNQDFWKSDLASFISSYESHSVSDYLGKPVPKERFLIEMNETIDRIGSIDGEEGEIAFNINVGSEFITLVRNEFKNSILTEYTAIDFANDMGKISMLVMEGAFREAVQLLSTFEPNEFLTRARLDKYIAMLHSADAITYLPTSR